MNKLELFREVFGLKFKSVKFFKEPGDIIVANLKLYLSDFLWKNVFLFKNLVCTFML